MNLLNIAKAVVALIMCAPADATHDFSLRARSHRSLKGCKEKCRGADNQAGCIAICKNFGASDSVALFDSSTDPPSEEHPSDSTDPPEPATGCDSLSRTTSDPDLLAKIVKESLPGGRIFEYDGSDDSYIADGDQDMFDGGNAITSSIHVGQFENPCATGYLFAFQPPNQGPSPASSKSSSTTSTSTCCSGFWYDGRVPYTKGELVQDEWGPGSSYYTLEAPGIFVLSVKGAGVEEVKVNGMTGRADDVATVESFDIRVELDGFRYRALVKSIAASPLADAGAPSIVHVWIFPDCDSIPTPTHVFSDDVNCDDDGISHPGPDFDYLLVSSAAGHPDDEDIRALVERYISASTQGG